jgi:hypothetical protein
MFEVGVALGFLEATALFEGGVTGFGLFFFGLTWEEGYLVVIPCIKAFEPWHSYCIINARDWQ